MTRIMKNVTTVAAICVAVFLIAPVGKVNAYACSLCEAYIAGELSDEEIADLTVCDGVRGVIPMAISGVEWMKEPVRTYEEPIPVEIVVAHDEVTFVGSVWTETSYGDGQMPEIYAGYGAGYGTFGDTVYRQKIVSFTGPCGPQADWKLLPIIFDEDDVSEQVVCLYLDTVHGRKEEVVRRYDSKSGKETFRYRISAL